jgi:hypothetical protein
MPNFVIKHQPGIPEQDARKVAEYLEQDYTYLRKVLQLDLETQPEVRIYDTDLKYSRGSGERKGSAGAVFKRGILHVNSVRKLEAENRFAQSLSGELAMALLDPAIRRGCPQWLAQSFSVYHSGVMPDLSPPVGRKLHYFSDLDQDIQEYPDPPGRQEVEFLLGTTMKFFVESYGEERAFLLFRMFDGTVQIEDVFRSSFGEEFDVIEKAWSRHITGTIGDLPSRNNRNE